MKHTGSHRATIWIPNQNPVTAPKLITNDTQVSTNLKILLITVVRRISRLDYNPRGEKYLGACCQSDGAR